MNVSLRPITKANWEECIRLKPGEGQTKFVASNLYSLAESKFNPEMVPLGIYHEETMVGFLMWGLDPDDGCYWIIRLMVGADHQGKGYGRAALTEILAELRQRPDCTGVTLGYVPGNEAAEKLYDSLGFRPTGDEMHGEIIARLSF